MQDNIIFMVSLILKLVTRWLVCMDKVSRRHVLHKSCKVAQIVCLPFAYLAAYKRGSSAKVNHNYLVYWVLTKASLMSPFVLYAFNYLSVILCIGLCITSIRLVHSMTEYYITSVDSSSRSFSQDWLHFLMFIAQPD